MKKLLAFLLALTTVLSLCACGADQPSPPSASVPGETILPSEPDEQLPAQPTEAEMEMLNEYARIYSWISGAVVSLNRVEEYQQLMAMDKSVIYRWRDTEYAPKYVDDLLINWDIDEVLSKFVRLENVLLSYTYSREDFLGNIVMSQEYEGDRYDENGQVASSSTDSHYIYTKDENGRIIEIRLVSNPQYGDVKVLYLTTLTYDENGNKVKETVMDKYGDSYDVHYFYDSENRLIRIEDRESGAAEYVTLFKYDDQGRKIEHESQTYINGMIYSASIEKFEYDEKGHLKSGTKTRNHYEHYFSSVTLESYSIDESTYTCDDYGNIIKEKIISGDTYYCSGYKEGEVEKTIYGPETYEYVYGDYYVYTDDNRPK